MSKNAHVRGRLERHVGPVEGSAKPASTLTVLSTLPKADYMRTIHEVLSFVDGVCCVAVQLDATSFRIQDAILGFYELASTINHTTDLPMTFIPSHGAVYACVLAAAPPTVSRMCGVLADLYDEVRAVRDAPVDPDLPDMKDLSGLKQIDYFNKYVGC